MSKGIVHKHIEFEPIFPAEVHLIIGDTWGSIDDYTKEVDFSVSLLYQDSYIAVTQSNGGVVGIFMPRNQFQNSSKKDPLDILVHESIHAAYFIISHIQAQISYENQELVAYMVDYIFRGFKKVIQEEVNGS